MSEPERITADRPKSTTESSTENYVAAPRVVSWWSAGAASTIATKLAIAKHGAVTIAYCETGAEHPSNVSFAAECAAWFGHPIERIHSEDYASTWEVWEKRRYLAGISGAPCTTELKVKPRLAFQRPTDVHVFGYTADGQDVARAKALRDNYPELSIETPLIDAGITKASCLAMVGNAGLTVPPLYALGFQNNNCIPCVKATSPDYWALIRKVARPEFDRMAALSRDLNVRLCRLNGERAFIDEIPADQPTTNPIAPSCDFLCHLVEMDIQGGAE